MATSVVRAFKTAGMGTVETAVVKATFDDEERPKQKHISTLIQWIDYDMVGSGNHYRSSNNDSQENLLSLLHSRMANAAHSWKIILKSLIVMHSLFRDGDEIFIKECFGYGIKRLFGQCPDFLDTSSASARTHSSFIHRYYRYLIEKANVYDKLGYNIEKKVNPNNKNFFDGYSPNKLGRVLV